MKKLLTFLLTVITGTLLIVTPALAVNTHSADFNGSNHFLSRTDADCETAGGGNCLLDLENTDFTFAIWLNPKTAPPTGSNSHNIVNKYFNGPNSYLIGYNFFSSDRHIQVGVTNGSDESLIRTAYTFDLDSWTHLAVTYSSSTGFVQIFLASSSQNHFRLANYDSGVIGGMGGQSADFKLGSEAGSAFWDGLMDDLRIYNKILTISELNDTFEAELTVTSSIGLITYYKWDGSPTLSVVDDANDADEKNTLTNNNTVTPNTDIPFSVAAAAIIPKKVGIMEFGF